MSEISPESNQALYIPTERLVGIEAALGITGSGAFGLEGVITENFRQDLLREISDPHAVQWRDAGDTYINGRGIEVVQNHDVFALKAGGDLEPIWNVPLMTQLAIEVEEFVQSLSDRYPALEQWRADEMSYHRYYDPKVGLSYHRDNMRFTGLIVVLTIQGESDFQVVERTPKSTEFDRDTGRQIITDWNVRNEWAIHTTPGSMVLTRATGLQAWQTTVHNPEHAVMNVSDIPRISFMVRANSRPTDRAYGFEYVNWP